MSTSSNKFLVGIFDDEDVLMHSISHVRHDGGNIHDVLTPYPIHGIEDAMGFKRSRLSRAAFLFGLLGFTCAQSFIFFVLNVDWPMNIGGKSTLPYPDFIPVSFECTVLFAAYGMVFTFLIVSNLLPGVKIKPFDIRSTDDKFVMVFDLAHNTKTVDELTLMLKSQGASEVYEKVMD